PGGGQFTLQIIGQRLVEVVQGLPIDGNSTVRASEEKSRGNVVQMSVFELGDRLGLDMSSIESFQVGQEDIAHDECPLRDQLIQSLVTALEVQKSVDSSKVTFPADSRVEHDGAAY
ncbi:MAG: hypothetical protein N2C12_08040, partial [Planctomycetales bacterium]